MSILSLEALPQAQRDRLCFIDLRLRFFGDVQRQHIIARFSVQLAAATRDLHEYKTLAPKNTAYDGSAKTYLRLDSFRPLFDFAPERVLTWLASNYGDSQPRAPDTSTLVPCETMSTSAALDLEILSTVTRAIAANCALEIGYRSLSSGFSKREIVPFALADTGSRWHVRAFDRRSGTFRDFVLGRIADAGLLVGAATPSERAASDDQWMRMVELELVPHPANVKHPDTIEAEYRMEQGVLRCRTRAALAGYALRRLNVDCTPDHSLRGGEFHLWLRNSQALYGVENLVLAPGHRKPVEPNRA